MGAWGPGNFENDEAVDWISDARESGDPQFVVAALTKVADASGFIEAPDGCAALAAAEVVAAALGRPPGVPSNDQVEERLPMLSDFAESATDSVVEVAELMPEVADQADLARRALVALLDPEDSELYGLWDDADAADWLAVLQDLGRRLAP